MLKLKPLTWCHHDFVTKGYCKQMGCSIYEHFIPELGATAWQEVNPSNTFEC